MKKIYLLIVEDEAPIREMLKFALPSEFCLLEAENAKEASLKIANQMPDIILLDWMLPGKSGIDFVRELKKNKSTQDIPVIMLTAKAEEENKIKGLDFGADDYVTKPFSPRELIARIKTILRRGPLLNPEGILTIKNLSLNTHTEEVYIDGKKLALPPICYRLLHFFITHPGKVYSREHLLQHIWSNDLEKNDRVVDVQIKRLREILEPLGHKNLIQTVRGSGYKYDHEN